METRFLQRGDGRLAYSVEGHGPLVVCVPGEGDLRQEYRHVSPILVGAGFRVATMDLRGHGESSTRWDDLSAEAIGDDIVALVHHLDASRALVVGTSIAGCAVVSAAAADPVAIGGCVLIGPLVRDGAAAWERSVQRMLFRPILARPWGAWFWMRMWRGLFATARPPDFDAYAASLHTKLSEPGRLASVRGMMFGPSRRHIENRLCEVHVPVVVVMGTADRDFKDPVHEAVFVASRVNGQVVMIDGAGHYPHVEFPEKTAQHVIAFVRRAGDGRRCGASLRSIDDTRAAYPLP